MSESIEENRDLHVAQKLLDEGFLSREELNRSLAIQRRNKKKLMSILLESESLDRNGLLRILGEELDVPAVDLNQTFGDPMVLDIIPREKALEFKVIPLFEVDNTLTVAMPDPDNLEKIAQLEFLSGKHILPVLALEDDIDQHLKEYYGKMDPDSGLQELVFQTPGGEKSGHAIQIDQAEADRPIVRLVNLILARAIQENTSDIHMEPSKSGMVIRYRIDGRLKAKDFRIPASATASVTSRIKILANIDISEKRIPQDGKIQILYRNRSIDVRVSTFPTIFGEKVVMRLLDKEKQNYTLDNIGMSELIRSQWKDLLRRREGILLVTGPTGSGKSSTLFATLQHINKPDINIVTLEDPVEYEIPGVSQGQVNERAGFTFAKGLRSILRQDPDVVLVGEIRDLETAQISIQAALTGHLVLSTLHTNDAPSAITRLVDMGVQRFLVAAGVIGVMAQRLVRRACPHCLEEAEPTEEELRILQPWLEGGLPFLEGKGCRHCDGSGYRGRVGVHELLVLNKELSALITADASEDEILQRAEDNNYRRMWWDGVEKVIQKQTTLRELLRHIQPDEPRKMTKNFQGGQHGTVSDSPAA